MFYLNSTLNFGNPPVLVLQFEVYYKDRLLTGLTAQQNGTTAQWYQNKTSLGKMARGGKSIRVKDGRINKKKDSTMVKLRLYQGIRK